jgi:hypothetical protein
MSTPLGTECISPSSANKMHEASREFYNNLAPFTVTDGGKKEFADANEAINNATNMNHLRYEFVHFVLLVIVIMIIAK